MANVSVVITAHNEEEFIGSTIESVLAQDLPPYEIIVVNDGSTDGTQRVIDKYSRSRGDLIQSVVLPRNGGAPFARNEGARKAIGELVAFLDGDDLWLPVKLAKQCALLEQHNGVAYTYASAIEFGDGWVNPKPDRLGLSSGVYGGPSLCLGYLSDAYWNFWPSGLMIQRNAFLRSGGFVEALGAFQHWEDYFYACALALNEQAYVLDEPLTYYRVHDASCSKRAETTKKTIVDERVGIEWFVSHLSTHGPRPLLEDIRHALERRLAHNVQRFTEALKERPNLAGYSDLYAPSVLDKIQNSLNALSA